MTDENLKILQTILEDSGKILMSFFEKDDLNRETKPDDSIVTEADLASEKAILAAIRQHFPKDKVYSEEAGLSSQDRTTGSYIWIIDPLDGTTNFANGYPFFCISVARGVFLKNGKISVELGGVYDPYRCDLFLAARGLGSFKNGKRVSVRTERPVEESFLVTGFAYHKGDQLEKDVREFLSVAERCQSIRRDGAAALDLAYVACGIYDAYWENGLKPWDVAAGSLLVSEAGGQVSNSRTRQAFNVEEQGLICGTETLFSYLKEKLSCVS